MVDDLGPMGGFLRGEPVHVELRPYPLGDCRRRNAVTTLQFIGGIGFPGRIGRLYVGRSGACRDMETELANPRPPLQHGAVIARFHRNRIQSDPRRM